MDQYHYQTLSQTDSIRLLYVCKDDSKPHALSLSLKEVHLADKPEFSAVSYTWQLPEYPPKKHPWSLDDDPGAGKDYAVECDGKTRTISENLFRFLLTAVRALDQHGFEQRSSPEQDSPAPRKRPKTSPRASGLVESLRKRPLWIDAFCINQSDPKERQHQVLLMDKIYSRAQSVLVWLGETEPGHDFIWVHDVFIPLLAKISRQNPTVVAQFVADPLCKSASVVDLLGEDVCSRWAFSWLSFANFLDKRRWFHRGWIVQEVALARAENVFLLCGQKELRWTRLTAFSHFLQLAGWTHTLRIAYNTTIGLGNFGTIPRGKAPIGAKVRAIDEAYQLITTKSTQQASTPTEWYHSASDLISKLRSSRFEDPRDHIYGCLGMLSRMLPEGFSNPIVPDYEKTVSEVYTSVAAMLLTNLTGLSELSKVEDPSFRSQQPLPTWVPDYSVPHRGNLGLGDTALPPTISKGQEGLSTTALFPRVVGPGLMVRGAKLDFKGEMSLTDPWTDISAFHEALFKLLIDAEDLHHTNMVRDFWNTLARGNLNAYRGNERGKTATDRVNTAIPLARLARSSDWNKKRAVRKRTVAGADHAPQRLEDPEGFVKERVITKLARIAQSEMHSNNAEFKGVARTVWELFSQINVEKPALGKEPIAAGIWDILSSAALYVTVGGKLGIGPVSASSKADDPIWMLEGSDRLFLLREADRKLHAWTEDEHGVQAYHLIGETFVHGVDVKEEMRELKERLTPIILV
ncbi:heterokaryon incompatibility protein-domain-containing protein [Immersiella caudata]|uniref:Heterokaryon incompatibility protein-domain-containing protein n=1 Tax=Immersiella caudata TaxID=314043 RepID=A0AA39WVY5_9PEZI|nr:heterokaryon incompatibility protein-domain-containing protein [Immersiella caudata]